MKKYLISILLFVFIFSIQSKAQLVVSDPTQTAINQAGWIQTLAKSEAQVQSMVESKNLLTKSIELYSKVSTTISSISTISDMISTQVTLISLASKELSRMDYQSPTAYGHYVNLIQEIIGENKSNIVLLQKIVSPSVKMTDGERLTLIRDLKKESKSQLSHFFSERNRFNELNNNIQIIKSLKSKKF